MEISLSSKSKYITNKFVKMKKTGVNNFGIHKMKKKTFWSKSLITICDKIRKKIFFYRRINENKKSNDLFKFLYFSL